MSQCMVCTGHNHCKAQYPYRAWKVKEFGTVHGEGDMLSALQDGPIVCGMHTTEAFNALDSFEVYSDEDPGQMQELAVSIVGYGETDTDSKQKYWVARNVWGDYWGDHGFFRIVRGVNNLGIETACYWAVPEDSAHIVNNSDSLSKMEVAEYGYVPPVRSDAYPQQFSWSAINGTSYIGQIRNQNVPNFCLSDWGFAVTSMMSDRLNVERAAINQTSAWPPLLFSVQSLLNVPTSQIKASPRAFHDD